MAPDFIAWPLRTVRSTTLTTLRVERWKRETVPDSRAVSGAAGATAGVTSARVGSAREASAARGSASTSAAAVPTSASRRPGVERAASSRAEARARVAPRGETREGEARPRGRTPRWRGISRGATRAASVDAGIAACIAVVFERTFARPAVVTVRASGWARPNTIAWYAILNRTPSVVRSAACEKFTAPRNPWIASEEFHGLRFEIRHVDICAVVNCARNAISVPGGRSTARERQRALT